MQTLLHYLAMHGVTAYEMADGRIKALSVYTRNGIRGEEWIALAPTFRAVRTFCGY